MKNKHEFINHVEEQLISKKISELEKNTSGEIHVHITDRNIAGDILAFSRSMFTSLGLHHTQDKNAVLILISTTGHKFAIVGDEGIHKIIGQSGWDNARNIMARNFSAGDYAVGIISCIEEVGNVLKDNFPKSSAEHNINEISNEISRS